MRSPIALCLALFSAAGLSAADDGYDFWLRYQPISQPQLRKSYDGMCAELVVMGDGEVLDAAKKEIIRGVSKMLERDLPLVKKPSRDGALILATEATAGQWLGLIQGAPLKDLSPEGFAILPAAVESRKYTMILGKTDRGALYGAHHFLRLMQTQTPVANFHGAQSPASPLRLFNMWDNPGGSVERGYAGPSVLYEKDRLLNTPDRHNDYGRLMASIGINGVAINNVNTAGSGLSGWKLLTSQGLREVVVPLADIFRRHGVRVYLSINFASPTREGLGDLTTADPLDPGVRRWWKQKADEIYALIPDFGGWLIKADSEGQAGPSQYGRNHADGANMLAEALQPHGGTLIWRAFVYGFKGKERASQAYEQFQPLDGQFAPNAAVQIKNGPLDFQVREPASPLFGAMPQTNQVIELQITQEYTGHSTHLCFLVPMWKEVLDFDTHAKGQNSTVARIVSGDLFGNTHAGIAGVLNIGRDQNWTGHLLAQANTFGFGRLAWDPGFSAKSIAEDWVKMTFGCDPEVVQTISNILLSSWPAYENYTSPLGVGVMCAGDHFNPDPAARQGGFHKADATGVGMDRTVATGTGFAGQYFPPWRERFESLETCPEELLLFFHHVPYTHKLQSGKTLIQHIYDTHRQGVEQVEKMRNQWESLRGKIDEEQYQHVLDRFSRQIEHARIWRDSINGYFTQKTQK